MRFGPRAWLAACALALVAAAAGRSPAQDFSEVQFEILARDQGFTEGPAWSKDGYLVWSDTRLDRIMKWVPGRAPEVLRAHANGPSGNAFDQQGRLYTCETHARRLTRAVPGGKIEVLAERWEGKRLNAPNDIVVGRNGHAYFTDPAFGAQADTRELDFYGVYHIPPHGPMRLVAKPAGRPDGIALSPNGRVLYVANADERNLRAYDLDRDGAASNERILVAAIAGVPGGVRVDDQGNLYVAAGGIAVYSPEGRLIRTIEVAGRASNCGFGEIDLKTLFITARGTVYRARFDVRGAY
jgi:gluconolactonase